MVDLAGEKPIFYGYTGPIDSAGATRIAAAFNSALNDGVDVVHFAFSSPGGVVADGIYLYNHLRGLPLKIHAYNLSSVSSIAVAVFVAADKRYCSAHGTFMIHATSFMQLPDMTAQRLSMFLDSTLADDERTESILRERTRLSDELLNARRSVDVHISPDVALKQGVVDEITEFAIPQGYSMFQI
ncbi:MAG: ATP-dependent Clp protease proteolytic subunit [Pseudoxanthomonas sp.]